MRISHTLAVQNKVKLRVLARLLHRVDITIIIIIRHERHVLSSPEEQGQISEVAVRCWASCDSVLSHRVSAFRNVKPELPLQRGPAGAGRSKMSIRLNYTDLRQM